MPQLSHPPHPTRQRLHPWPALLLLLLVSGCSVFPDTPTEQQVYQLLPPEVYRLDSPRIPADLMISRLSAQPGYGTSAMAYRESDYMLQYFASSRWSDHPLRMLQPALIAGLQAQGPFRHVFSGQSGLPADYRLEAQLIRLEQDFRTTPSRVHLWLTVQLIHAQSREISLSRTFRVSRESATPDAEGGVRAANQALADLLTEMATALHQAVTP